MSICNVASSFGACISEDFTCLLLRETIGVFQATYREQLEDVTCMVSRLLLLRHRSQQIGLDRGKQIRINPWGPKVAIPDKRRFGASLPLKTRQES